MEIIQIHHLGMEKGEVFECPHCKKKIEATIDSEGDSIFLEGVKK